jgi:hypothetical protein
MTFREPDRRPMTEEKRAFKRTRYFVEVELDGLVKARLSDISPDGAFIESRAAFTPGAMVQIRFTVVGRDVETAAEVRHCCPGIGMGVKFVALEPALRAEIARLLASGDLTTESLIATPES